MIPALAAIQFQTGVGLAGLRQMDTRAVCSPTNTFQGVNRLHNSLEISMNLLNLLQLLFFLAAMLDFG